MALSKKKSDPISDKARALNDRIAALEAEIKTLDTQLARPPAPKSRSAATPLSEIINRPIEKPAMAFTPKLNEPVFEEISQAKLVTQPDNIAPEYFNDLGLRKYDLPAMWNRLRNHFRGPTTSNPRLVNYLAAGGVQGLRPLRYEKRVARNRFFVLVVVVTAVLIGLFRMLWR
jgi:hypothetical protein